MGGITEIATGAPGYNSVLPNTMSPLARTLKLNGYSTAQFGKCHEVPVWETSPVGPFDAWPTGGGGFEYFYGFIGGEANQWYPTLYEGTTPVEPKKTPEEGYHLMEDMTDKAIDWIGSRRRWRRTSRSSSISRPAPPTRRTTCRRNGRTSTRASSTQGWDKLREETFARQKELGVIPADCELTARHKEIPAWDEMPEALKPVLRRQMEVYAGFLEYTDHHVGRLLDSLKKLNILDDTLVYYIIGDNGASAEGTLNGTFNEMLNFNGMSGARDAGIPHRPARQARRPGVLQPLRGRLGARDEHALPVDQAGRFALGRNAQRHDRPLAEGNQGQGRDPLAVPPRHRRRADDPRGGGPPEPLSVNGVQQKPIEGVSMLYSFNDAKAAERHETQYFEMFGNRGIYHKGWTAVTRHKTPWLLVGAKTCRPSTTTSGNSTTPARTGARRTTSSKQMPEKLHELQRLWLIEAARYNVLPLDDGLAQRINPDIAGRPVLIKGNSQILFGGMGRLSENCVLNIKNKSHSVTAEIDVPAVRRRGRDHRARRQHRRLEPLREGRQAEVLLQPGRRAALLRRGREPVARRRPSGADGVRLCRGRPRQGRQGNALRRRQEGRRRRCRRRRWR